MLLPPGRGSPSPGFFDWGEEDDDHLLGSTKPNRPTLRLVSVTPTLREKLSAQLEAAIIGVHILAAGFGIPIAPRMAHHCELEGHEGILDPVGTYRGSWLRDR